MDVQSQKLQEPREAELFQCLEKIVADRDVRDSKYIRSPLSKAVEILKDYQLQPALLDPFLPKIYSSLMPIIERDLKSGKIDNNGAYTLLQTVATVRGFKQTSKLLPHGVQYVEPVLNLCRNLSTDFSQPAAVVLGQWLGLLVLEPFDLSSFSTQGYPEGSLQMALASFLASMFMARGSARECAVSAAASLASRPDAAGEQGCRTWFINASFEMMKTKGACGVPKPQFEFRGGKNQKKPSTLKRHEPNASLFSSGFEFVTLILKRLPREVAESIASHKDIGLLGSFDTAKECVRLVGTVAMVFLQPRNIEWSYKRTISSLRDNIAASTKANASPVEQKGTAALPLVHEAQTGEELNNKDERFRRLSDMLMLPYNTAKVAETLKSYYPPPPDPESDLVGFDVPTEFDDCIDILLCALTNNSTGIRTRAASALAKCMERLPAAFAGEILDAIEALLSPAEDEGTWHGALMAMAECARRGLVPLNRLPSVVGSTIDGLSYVRRKGENDLGSQVRDSAAYVAWSLARVYAGAPLQPFALRLAAELVVCAVFDHELGPRRAAAAAFQELVGRQGTSEGVFVDKEGDTEHSGALDKLSLASSCLPVAHKGAIPGGIALVTELEYMALGTVNGIFSKTLPTLLTICQGFYAPVLAARLVGASGLTSGITTIVPIAHWDKAYRAMAVGAVELLAKVAPRAAADVIVPYCEGLLSDIFQTYVIDRSTVPRRVIAGIFGSLACCTRAAPVIVAEDSDEENRDKGSYILQAASNIAPWLLGNTDPSIPETHTLILAFLATRVCPNIIDLSTEAVLSFIDQIRVAKEIANDDNLAELIADTGTLLVELLATRDKEEGVAPEDSQINNYIQGIAALQGGPDLSFVKRSCMIRLLSSLSSPVIPPKLMDKVSRILTTQIAGLRPDPTSLPLSPEARREMTRTVCLLARHPHFLERHTDVLLTVLGMSLGDYEIDKRGDIGLLQRRAAVEYGWQFIEWCFAYSPESVKTLVPLFAQMYPEILRFLLDKQDMVREEVGFFLKALHQNEGAFTMFGKLILKVDDPSPKYSNHRNFAFQLLCRVLNVCEFLEQKESKLSNPSAALLEVASYCHTLASKMISGVLVSLGSDVHFLEKAALKLFTDRCRSQAASRPVSMAKGLADLFVSVDPEAANDFAEIVKATGKRTTHMMAHVVTNAIEILNHFAGAQKSLESKRCTESIVKGLVVLLEQRVMLFAEDGPNVPLVRAVPPELLPKLVDAVFASLAKGPIKYVIAGLDFAAAIVTNTYVDYPAIEGTTASYTGPVPHIGSAEAEQCLKKLVMGLGHSIPVIRSHAAMRLLEVFAVCHTMGELPFRQPHGMLAKYLASSNFSEVSLADARAMRADVGKTLGFQVMERQTTDRTESKAPPTTSLTDAKMGTYSDLLGLEHGL